MMISTSRRLLLLAGVALSACNQASHAPPATTGQTSEAAVSGTANTAVTWSVQEASGGTVTSSGLYTAPSTPGTYHVVAVCQADPSIGAMATVMVTSPPPDSFVVSPNPAIVAAGATQQFTVVPSEPVTWSVTQAPISGAPVYPVKVSANGRYLVDQVGKPWRIQADAGWFLAAKATPTEVTAYLDDRAARGFNAFYMMALVDPVEFQAFFSAAQRATDPVSNYNLDAPFTGGTFTGTKNEAYWSYVDFVIDEAAKRDLVVMFAYTYHGISGPTYGLAGDLGALTQQQATDWGTWLGNRYRDKQNIIWFTAGDYNPSGTVLTNYVATINGIKGAGAAQPWMAELSNPDQIFSAANPTLFSAADAAPPGGPAGHYATNSYYGYGPGGVYDVFNTADTCYRISPATPCWMQEGTYEGENNKGVSGLTDFVWTTRRARFWSVLAGSLAGDGFGSHDIWPQATNWTSNLGTSGSVQSGYAFSLFQSIPWWDLQPRGTGTGFAGTLITSGGGTLASGSTNYVAAARTSDGRLIIAYYPGTNGGTASASFTVDMTKLSAGPVRARWWNPTTGAYTAIGSFANTGSQSFTTPGANGAGNDWVLLLDAASASCGTITASGVYTAPAVAPAGVTCQVVATSQANPASSASAQLVIQ